MVLENNDKALQHAGHSTLLVESWTIQRNARLLLVVTCSVTVGGTLVVSSKEDHDHNDKTNQ